MQVKKGPVQPVGEATSSLFGESLQPPQTKEVLDRAQKATTETVGPVLSREEFDNIMASIRSMIVTELKVMKTEFKPASVDKHKVHQCDECGARSDSPNWTHWCWEYAREV